MSLCFAAHLMLCGMPPPLRAQLFVAVGSAFEMLVFLLNLVVVIFVAIFLFLLFYFYFLYF